MNHSDWLAERRLGIGGSDVASMLNIGYGCRRRLVYDKRGVPEDFPRNENNSMRLGKVLEPFFAQRYIEETGRTLQAHSRPFVHLKMPWLRVNIDREAYRSALATEPGVHEIKAMGREMFYRTKREGLPEDYILQVQHGLLVTGWSWGAYTIGSRDSGDILYWDVPRDEELCGIIEAEAARFWPLVENGPLPEALEPDDKRCQKCSWRKTCHGDALVQIDTGEIDQAEELRPLLTEYLDRKDMAAQADELLEETKEELKSSLGARQAVMVAGHKVYFRPQSGRVLYRGKELAAAYKKYVGSIITLLANGELTVDKAVELADEPESFVDIGKPSRPLKVY